MTRRTILSADSTCDLGDELRQLYDVRYIPLHITIGGGHYTDNVDITPEETFAVFRETGELPKTAAVSVGEYLERFEPWVREGSDVIHVNISSAISASHENAKLAASELAQKSLGGVHVIDSRNLSTGSGLLVLEAAERIAAGLPAAQAASEVEALRDKTHASFVIDTMEFLHAGGRCSSLTALAASVLKIKPCIEVLSSTGTMDVGKKYRGRFEKVLLQYTKDKLAQYAGSIDYSRAFVTHTPMEPGCLELVVDYLRENADFKTIHVTDASTTISSHCGPNTLGVLFMTK